MVRLRWAAEARAGLNCGELPGRRCDIARKRRSGSGRRGTYKKKPPQHKVICSVCGEEIVTSVRPPAGQALTCLKCVYSEKKSSE